ncbi:MAG: helix-turn-helix domain-containing protein [Pseudomonadota bacterium]
MRIIIYMTINMDTVSRKSAHNARVRARVLDAAAREIREKGLRGASIDTIMGSADLTRGAFYAHFASKAALFEAVLREAHPLLRQLADIPDDDLDALLKLFRDYLAPGHLSRVKRGCTLASLSSDAGRGTDTQRRALGDARSAMLAEMARATGGKIDAWRLDAALTLASGAVLSAQADNHPPRQARLLDAAYRAFVTLLA